MADDREWHAVDIIARKLVAQAWSNRSAGNDSPDHTDYPDLSDEQWTAIVTRADRIVDTVSGVYNEEQFLAAYEYLTGEAP